MFQAPPHGGTSAPAPAVSDSIVTLVATLPYPTLVDIADQKLPQSVPLGGDGHIACLDVPFVNPGHVGSHEECINKPYLDFRGAGTERVCAQVPDFTGPSIGTHNQCADYHWHADINKDGGFQASKNSNSIRFAQAIHVTGQAGVGGTLADILSLKGKNIDIHATPRFDVVATLDGNWCPVVHVVPNGSWIDSASIEVVGHNCVGFDLGPLGHPQLCAGPINLGISDELNHEFDKYRGDVEKGAQSAIPCDTIRPKIVDQWRPYAIKLDTGTATPLYFNIDPKTAAFSGLIPEDGRIRVAVRVGAKTVLSPAPIDTGKVPLPNLEVASPAQGGVEISLQAVAPFGLLKDQLALASKGKSFKTNVPGGTAEVTIDDVDLYPSKDSIAIGLKITAKTPGRWLNTSGWVYLSGKPKAVPADNAVTVENIAFATVLDNTFWSTVQGLFENEILTLLKAHATFDLSKQIEDATARISSAVARADVPGLKLRSGKPNISLDGVYVATDNLVAVVKMSMTLDAEVTEAIIK